MRLAVSDYASPSASHYKDEAWNDGNYLRLSHPDYYRLEQDAADNRAYKIIDMYPDVFMQQFIRKDAFLEQAADFTGDQTIIDAIRAIKS